MAKQRSSDELSLDDALAVALAELAEAIKPEETSQQQLSSFYYLLWLWGSFTVYQVRPFVSSSDGEEGAGGGTGSKGPKIITLENGRTIFDYGYYLTTSTGSDLTSFTTGKLLECTDRMIDILAERGATHINVIGHPSAVRKAWIRCLDKNVEIANFMPTIADWQLRSRVRELRKQLEQTKGRIKDLIAKYRR